MIAPDCVIELCANFAMPKSRILTVPSSSTRTFAGLMSRWTMPCSCAYARPSQSCADDLELRRQRQRLRPAQHRVKVLAAQEFHHDVRRAVVLAQFVDRDDVRVLQPRDGLGLALEPLARRRVEREIDQHHLERDVAVERRVLGAIEHAHPAAAKQAQDFVAANMRRNRGWHLQSYGAPVSAISRSRCSRKTLTISVIVARRNGTTLSTSAPRS